MALTALKLQINQILPKYKSFCALMVITLFLSASPAALAGNHYSKAVSLYNKKEYRKALVLFQLSQEEGIQGANSAYYIGLCYHQLKDSEKAKAAYLNVIKKYPKTRVARQAFNVLSTIDPSIAKIRQKSRKNSGQKTNHGNLQKKIVVKYKNRKNSNHILVPATINNVSTNMLFDTGASLTFCKQSFLDKEGITITNTKSSHRVHGVGGEVPAKIGLVRITIGTLTRVIPLVIEQDQSSTKTIHEKFNLLPILGQNFFKDFTCEIDDTNKTITFSKQSSKKISFTEKLTKKSSFKSSNEVPFYRVGNNIIVKPKINGRECEMIFDTGADAVVFADRHLALCGLNRPTEASSSRSGGVGGTKHGYNFYVKSIKLGPVERKNVRCSVVLNSRFSKPLLGQTFLKGLKYRIDPERNVIIFKSPR